MNARSTALKSKMNPVAKTASRIRGAVGDRNFAPKADVMIAAVRRARESRANDKRMGY